MSPLISIALPAYNGESTIFDAVVSIINQSFTDWELFILDDGSVDHTTQIIAKFNDPRIKIISDGKNLGIASRLNQAINLSNGIYFARMDQDDICYPNRLEQQFKFMEANPEVDILGSSVIFFQGDGIAMGKMHVKEIHQDITSNIWDSMPIPHPTWFCRLDWIKLNLYSTTSILSEDQDLLIRASKCSTYACLPIVLLGYRQNIVSLKKEIKSRLSYFCDSFSFFWLQKNFKGMLLTFVTQILKILIVCFSSIFGLNKILLYRRYKNLSKAELDEWRCVYYHNLQNGKKIENL